MHLRLHLAFTHSQNKAAYLPALLCEDFDIKLGGFIPKRKWWEQSVIWIHFSSWNFTFQLIEFFFSIKSEYLMEEGQKYWHLFSIQAIVLKT